MTATRTSLAFAIEDTFCGGPGASQTKNKGKWLAAPPNSFFTHGHQRSTNRMNAAGSKKQDQIAYGGYNGTWSWSFTLDQEYLEPLLAVFEDQDPKGLVDALNTDLSYTEPTKRVADLTISEVSELPEGEDLVKNTCIYELTEGVSKAWYIFSEGLDTQVRVYPLGNELGDKLPQYAWMYYVHDGQYSATPWMSGTTVLTDQYCTLAQVITKDGAYKYYPVDRYVVVIEDGKAYVVDSTGDKQEDGEQQTSATGTRVYKHVFKKKDVGRCKSLCFRRLQLNGPAGGVRGDEILEIYGAVCTEFRLSASAGSSQIQVNMSGFSAKEEMKITSLEATEYKPYDGEHAMFACLFKGSDPSAQTYIANVQSLQIAVKNNAERMWCTCSPFLTNYYEGITNYELTADVYSYDPTLFRQRLYTGGRELSTSDPGWAQSDVIQKGQKIEYLKRPLCKGLVPMDAMTISSYDTCRDVDAGQDIGSTIGTANFRFDVISTGIVFKTMSWERGDSSKIMDNLSSAECQSMEIVVYSDVADYREPADKRYLNISDENMIKDNRPTS